MEHDSGTGWQPDPSGRHQLRYHDGTTFTGYVSDSGVVSTDADVPTGNPVAAGTGPTVPFASASAYDPPVARWPAPQSQIPPAGFQLSPYGGSPWTGPAGPPPPQKRRRVGLGIAIGIAVVEGVAIIALSVALVATKTTALAKPIGSTVSSSGSYTRDMGTVVYSSHFATDEHWPTGSLNANTNASLSNGQYMVQGSTTIHHLLLTPYGTPHSAISVEATVSDYSNDNVSLGVGCQSGSGLQPPLAYQVVVYPDGQWYIEEARIPGAVKTLDSGYTSALGTTATLQLTCVITGTTSDSQTTQLVAFVDGQQVGAIGDRIVHTSVGGYIPVLVMGSYGQSVHAAFNSMSVRSIHP